MGIKQTLTLCGLALPVLGGVWAVADYTGIRPPMMIEFQALAEEVVENSEKHLLRDARDLRAERAKLELLRRDFMDQGHSVPGWIRDRLVDIEAEQEEIRDNLEKVRSQQ